MGLKELFFGFRNSRKDSAKSCEHLSIPKPPQDSISKALHERLHREQAVEKRSVEHGAAATLKLCKDCKFYTYTHPRGIVGSQVFTNSLRYQHACSEGQSIDPVTGERKTRDCNERRKARHPGFSVSDSCGSEGLKWEQRVRRVVETDE